MRRVVALALTALLLLPAGAAAGAETEPNATLPDIEDEVMCTVCGTALQLSDSPQAERERVFINELISQGKTKDQIKDALVKEYGPEVLAVPEAEGFDLTAWIIPIGGVLTAIVLIGLAAWRWRRAGAEEGDADGPEPELDPKDAKRLETDLGRYQV